jgi:hypothetical protein
MNETWNSASGLSQRTSDRAYQRLAAGKCSDTSANCAGRKEFP